VWPFFSLPSALNTETFLLASNCNIHLKQHSIPVGATSFPLLLLLVFVAPFLFLVCIAKQLVSQTMVGRSSWRQWPIHVDPRKTLPHKITARFRGLWQTLPPLRRKYTRRGPHCACHSLTRRNIQPTQNLCILRSVGTKYFRVWKISFAGNVKAHKTWTARSLIFGNSNVQYLKSLKRTNIVLNVSSHFKHVHLIAALFLPSA